MEPAFRGDFSSDLNHLQSTSFLTPETALTSPSLGERSGLIPPSSSGSLPLIPQDFTENLNPLRSINLGDRFDLFSQDRIAANDSGKSLAPESFPEDSLTVYLSGLEAGSERVLLNQIMGRAIAQAQTTLQQFAQDPQVISLLQQAFGSAWSAQTVVPILQAWSAKDFSQLPPIQLISSALINHARGAFAQALNTIYLSQEYVLENAAHPGAIAAVLLEEMGHYLDGRLNAQDTPGDEGEIFAAIAQGISLTPQEFATLKAEDDSALVTLHQQPIWIEQAATTVTIKASDASAGEVPAGTTPNPGRFTLTRVGDTSTALTVTYTITGTATNGSDYTTLTNSAIIPIGATTQTITVTPINDALLESDETVIFTLNSSTEYTLGTAKTATVTLLDDDNPRVSVSMLDNESGESPANSGSFTFTRTGDLTNPLTVNFTFAGTATNGADYNLPTNVTIPAGAKKTTLTVTPINDSLAEFDETILLKLVNSANYNLGTVNSGMVAILDDDTTLNRITIEAPDAIATENSADTGTIRINRAGSTTNALTIKLALSGTATNGSDYATLNTTLTIPAGASSATLPITALNDALSEKDETVIVTLLSDSSYNASQTQNTATVTILDDDRPRLSIATTTNASEPSTPGQFTISRTGSTSSSLTVNYTVSGTATKGSDYTALSGSLTLPAGATSVVLPVTVLDDAIIESNETVIVTLSASAAYNLNSSATKATLTIADNDAATEPGNTLASAEVQAAAVFTRTQQVSSSDRDDFYRFSLTQSGIFTADLTGLTGDADIRLIQDRDGDGQVDTAQLYNSSTGLLDTGEILAWQWERGTTNESIRRFLTAGTYYLQVTSYNNQTANYQVSTNFTTAASDNRPFTIQLSYGTGINSTAQATIQKAAQYWQQVISYSTFNGSHTLSIQVVGDATVSSAATGGWTTLATDANGRSMATAGIVNLSTSYLNTLNTTANLNPFLLIHEMGHVFGLVDALTQHSFVNTSTGNYNANTYAGWAYGELKGTYTQTAIPMTTGLGASSDYTHWRETVFGNELLTDTATPNGGIMSALSLAALRDLGWNVNFGAAQPYTLPSGGTSTTLPPNAASSYTVNAGTSYSPSSSSGSLSVETTDQFYRLQFNGVGALSFLLNGLSTNVDLRLIYDANSNGVVDAGEVMATSTNAGTSSETITVSNLAVGTYYLDVYTLGTLDSSGNRVFNNTSYTLNLQKLAASALPITSNLSPVDFTNNLGKGTYQPFDYTTYQVGDTNIDDLFQFNFAGTTSLSLSLNGLTDNANLQLIYDADQDGVWDAGELIGNASNLGSLSETITLSGLAAGQYYIRVYRAGTVAYTPYTLRFNSLSIS